jgi:hypothetical protein
MALKREQELARLGDKLQQDKLQFEQQQAQADAQLTRDLDRQAAKVQAERAAAEDDRARLALLGSLPEELMVSLTASGANVNAVVEVARIKAFKAMSPEQIKLLKADEVNSQ